MVYVKAKHHQSFPTVTSHAAARCFNCGGPLAEPVASEYEPGRGAWLARCDRCCMSTWYDLVTQPIEDNNGQTEVCS